MTPAGQDEIESTIVEITGAEAGQVRPELGPMITEDFPEAMTGLIAHAATLG